MVSTRLLLTLCQDYTGLDDENITSRWAQAIQAFAAIHKATTPAVYFQQPPTQSGHASHTQVMTRAIAGNS